MIIKKISLENFQCYSGSLDENTFEFEEGLNVIIGDNGSGKSKLYDAFRWVLYDRVFNSSTREQERTSQVKSSIVSDKAKEECQVGESVFTRVLLHVVNNQSTKGLNDEYILERSYVIHKKSNDPTLSEEERFLLPEGSKEKVEIKDVLDFKVDNSLGAFEKAVKKLLPDDIGPYLWFQGEQVDSLIDFSDKKSLTKAIDALSDIGKYDELIEASNKVQYQANIAFERAQKQLSKDSHKSDELISEKERLEKIVQNDEENLSIINENIGQTAQEVEELYGKIDDAKELEVLRTKEYRLKERVAEFQEKIKLAEKDFNKNIFTKSWILRNAESIFNDFEKLQKKYTETRDETLAERRAEKKIELAQKERLPVNVPTRQYLDEMLDEKKCFVCSRDFDEEGVAQESINSLLERAKNTKVYAKDLIKQDFRPFFNSLYEEGFRKEAEIKNVDESFRNEKKALDNLNSRYSVAIGELKQIQEQIDQLVASGSVASGETSQIISRFKQLNKGGDQFKNNKIETEQRIEKNKEKIRLIKEELAGLVKGELAPEIIEKKLILDLFKEVAHNTRVRVFDEKIAMIEKEANMHFANMTADNKSVRGKIILERLSSGAYMPKNIGENGEELSSINDSNLILIKLATIMAIVSAKGKSTETYPLITDAPTSKFSDNYTIGFCNALGNVFSQSIIMSYDFYHNEELRNRLLTEVEHVGKVYTIEPFTEEGKRESRTSLKTKIEVIK